MLEYTIESVTNGIDGMIGEIDRLQDENLKLKFLIEEKIKQLDDSIFLQEDYLSRNEYIWSDIEKTKISMQIEILKEWQQWLEDINTIE